MDSLRQKQSLEERVSELEAQVAELQREMALLKAEEVDLQSLMATGEEALKDTPAPNSVVENEPVAETVVEETVVQPEMEAETCLEQEETAKESVDFQPMGRMQQALPHWGGKSETADETKATGKSWEAKIGKLLIPVAGSALIIFALILFGSLIQPRLTDTMKAVLMTLVSGVITGVGIWRMHRSDRFRTLFAALAGCGSAGLYVTLLVSHLVLGVLPEMPLMVCVVLWIAAMTALSKYKSRMFCFICYIGILVSAYMTVQRWGGSPVGLIVYMLSVGALFATNCTRRYKQDAWLLWQYPLVMLPMADNYDSSTLAQLLIFLSTAAVLVGQVIYYHRQILLSHFSVVPTILTLIVLMWCATQFHCLNVLDRFFFGGFFFGVTPLFDNPVAWSLLLSVTLLGLSALYYKLYGRAKLENWKAMFYLMGGFTAMVIPTLNFGAPYHDWCGTFFVPALLTLGIGCYYNKPILRYVGYLYLFFYTFGYAQNLDFKYVAQRYDTPSGELVDYDQVQCGVFLFFAALFGFGSWVWRRCSVTEQRILMACSLLGILELCDCDWLDVELTYLLLCAYFIANIFKPFITTDEVRQGHILQVLSILLALFVLPLRLYLAIMSETYALLQVPHIYGAPLAGLAASVLIWLLGQKRQSNSLKVFAYILMAINLLISMDNHYKSLAVWGVYLAVALGIAYWTWRHYNKTDKIGLAAMALCFLFSLCPAEVVGDVECWALCSLFIIICGVTHFSIDPRTGVLEPLSNKLCLVAHEFFLLLGTWQLSEPAIDLCLGGHSLADTSAFSTFLLVVVVLMLALINLRRVNGLMHYLPEHAVSIYNGLKFTWTLCIILGRFSAVSYLISLAGIVLAIAFIVTGFRFKFKGLRLYGLVLTMVCVIKLLFWDIVFDNAFYRPISFLVAGILLFLISFIYFRLEKNTSVLQDKSK